MHTLDTPGGFNGAGNASAIYIGNEGGTFGGMIIMTRIDGAEFSVLGLDLAELWVGNHTTYPNATMVRVTGNFMGGGSTTTYLTLDGILDGPGGVPDFESFSLTGFHALSSFEINGVDSAQIENFAFGVDDIEVSNQPGTPYCFGDGTGNTCPCGNLGAPGAGCANSSNSSGALLVATGVPSVASDSIVLTATDCPANKPGIFFQGTSQAGGGNGNLFGDGLLCVSGQIIRLETVFTDGTGSATSSAAISVIGAISPGDTRDYQFWFRDPAGQPCGSGFNLTNGWELTWN